MKGYFIELTAQQPNSPTASQSELDAEIMLIYPWEIFTKLAKMKNYFGQTLTGEKQNKKTEEDEAHEGEFVQKIYREFMEIPLEKGKGGQSHIEGPWSLRRDYCQPQLQ